VATASLCCANSNNISIKTYRVMAAYQQRFGKPLNHYWSSLIKECDLPLLSIKYQYSACQHQSLECCDGALRAGADGRGRSTVICFSK
jgi:hypothetical protein